MELFDEPQPAWVINGYLWRELKLRSPKLASMWPTTVPFFPVNDSTSGNTAWSGKPFFIYNEALRIEHSFYEIKKSTFVYSMRATPSQTLPLTNALQKIIDREDDAAKDVNDFNWLNRDDASKFCPIYFHSFSLYQNEPAKARDGAVEPFVVSNFMVVAKYNWNEFPTY